ncbi:hypothetical protein BLNAU_20966 [Blattamonas nauphoetae]|uniref:Uncharacterized protein n=1 Tax=Blattamonas nauphoetae TaxID=2049346 RepID=A0ABQ9WXA1_9EUKA|nr:hypothetical protein BLNAU_20966 [Blattamonas nauphoetae]
MENPIVIDRDSAVGNILLDVDPVDTLQTLFRDIFSDRPDLSNRSLIQLQQLLNKDETLIDILVTYEDLKNLSNLLTASQAKTSITNLSWILSTLACSSYDNCNSLVKSGLCLAVLEKATLSIVTKQSAFLYVHIWKILESFSENATLSLDPTINLLLPSVVTNTLSVLQKIPQSDEQTKGPSPFSNPQRSDIYRSFINFTIQETVSSMVHGIKTDLFEIIQSKQADLIGLNEKISPNKMPQLQELIGSTLCCIALPSISKRGLTFLEKVMDCPRHVEIILAFFFRLMSTNEGEIPSFISNHGISTLNILYQPFNLKAWTRASNIKTDILVLLVKRHPLKCSDFIQRAVISLSDSTSRFSHRKNYQEDLNRQLKPFWRIMNCYPEMTKENQEVIDWWMNSCLVHLLFRSGIAGDAAAEAIQAFTLLTKLDANEVTTLLNHTSLWVSPPPNFPFDLSADMSASFNSLHDVLLAYRRNTSSFAYFQQMLPFSLYNRLSTLLEDEERNRATIEHYFEFITKIYENTGNSSRRDPNHSKTSSTAGILLLYSLIRSERVRNLLVGIIGQHLFDAAIFHPIATLSTEDALLDLLLADAPDIPSTTIVQIDIILSKMNKTEKPVRPYTFGNRSNTFGNRPRAVEVAQLHKKAMNRLVSKKEGRWRALTELAVVPSGNATLKPDQCEAVLALLKEAGTDDRLFIALRVLSKHTLSEVFLLNNPTFVDGFTPFLRSHSRGTDNVELVLGVFSELARLQWLERSLEGDVVECVRELSSVLADKRSMKFSYRGHVLWSSGEALQTTLDMVGECTQLVQNQQLSDPLSLAPILAPFLSSTSPVLISAVLNFFAELASATRDTPAPFHALSQPIAVLGETRKPTMSLPLSDFLFQHWIISLEVLIQRFPDATNQALFFPSFRQVFQRSGKHAQSLLLQAVLGKLEQRLRALADEACGTRNVTQTRFLEGVGEQAEWERGVIESAIDTGQLDYPITEIIPRETLCTPKREPDLLHILQLLFSFYKTVNRLTLVFPDDTDFPDEYTWCRLFRPPLTSIRSAVLYAIQDESTTSENVRRLSRFFSFVFMLTDPECIPQHDDSERMLVLSFQSADPSDEILAVQMREEGFEDRREALLHKDQENSAVRELDEMNVGSETSRSYPYFGMRHVGLQLVLSPLLTLALVLTPSSLPSPPLLLVSPLSTVHTPSNLSHLSQPTLHASTATEADEGRTQLREGLIERGVSLAVVRVSGEPHPIHSAKDVELSSTFDERECLPPNCPSSPPTTFPKNSQHLI